MPYLFTVEVKYEAGKYILYNPSDLITNFPFLEGNIIIGKFVSTYRDGKIIRINKEFKSKLIRSGNYFIGEILEPNPLRAIGLPLPSTLLVVAHKYEVPFIKFEGGEEKRQEFPIIENVMLKGSTYSYFDDEVKRILKEEEAGLILEGTIFHPELEKHSLTLKEALLSFEQENFAFTKTCCRRILEDIKRMRARNLILNRLDRLYDDKLDGKISEEFYERKFKQYSKEKEEIESAIKRHEKANLKYYELGLNFYELSQKAKEIYQKAKIEEKRQLIKLVFKELFLNGNDLIFTYTKPFELLSKAISETNSSKIEISPRISTEKFEPAKMNSKTGVKSPICSVWRRIWNDFRTLKWIEEIDYPELIIKQSKQLLQAYS
jgi:hypothetical protein